MFAIIRDPSQLNKVRSAVKKMHGKYRDKLHELLVSAVWHAAKHGNPAVLTAAYNDMTVNDQAAFRGYLGEVQRLFIGSRDAMLTIKTANGMGIFSVKPKTVGTETAERLMDACEGRLINPNMETGDRYFYNWDVVKYGEERHFTDKQILAMLNRIVKQAERDNPSTEEVAKIRTQGKTALIVDVSPKVLKMIKDVTENVETIVDHEIGDTSLPEEATEADIAEIFGFQNTASHTPHPELADKENAKVHEGKRVPRSKAN